MTESEIAAVQAEPIAPFVRLEGHEDCRVSSGIHDCLTFGRGRLDDNGFWEEPCWECARAHEQQFPECGPCWPHTEEQIEKMGLRKIKGPA